MVYEWAKGTPFQEICQLTDVMEGSIVRAIVRLEETCRWGLPLPWPPCPFQVAAGEWGARGIFA